jgi:DNA-binding CsgD family transcriptional regulator
MTDFPPLTRRERRFLWLMTQGLRVEDIAHTFEVSGPTVRSLAHAVRLKLGTSTNTQSVSVAIFAGLIGPREDCGTRLGYRHHRRCDEDTCLACRRAHQEWTDRQTAYGFVPSRIPDLVREELLLLRAFDAGRTIEQVMTNWDVGRGIIERLVSSLYRKLDVAHLPVQHRREEALLEARRRGLLRLDPDVLPLRLKKAPPPASRPLGLTARDRETLAAVADGCSLREAAVRLGTGRSSVASRLNSIYRKLDIVHLPVKDRRERALTLAATREDLAVLG